MWTVAFALAALLASAHPANEERGCAGDGSCPGTGGSQLLQTGARFQVSEVSDVDERDLRESQEESAEEGEGDEHDLRESQEESGEEGEGGEHDLRESQEESAEQGEGDEHDLRESQEESAEKGEGASQGQRRRRRYSTSGGYNKIPPGLEPGTICGQKTDVVISKSYCDLAVMTYGENKLNWFDDLWKYDKLPGCGSSCKGASIYNCRPYYVASCPQVHGRVGALKRSYPLKSDGCLHIKNGNRDEGGELISRKCENSRNQGFAFPKTEGVIRLWDPDNWPFCLAVSGDWRLELKKCKENDKDQTFKFVKTALGEQIQFGSYCLQIGSYGKDISIKGCNPAMGEQNFKQSDLDDAPTPPPAPAPSNSCAIA